MDAIENRRSPDGRADIAICRTDIHHWWIHSSAGGGGDIGQWGFAGDIPVPGDYNGDRRRDVDQAKTLGWYSR